jgi:PPOX class probable F420-dependent enzyme
MVELSDNMKRFVREVFPAIVGTKRPNGSVHMNPIWFEYLDGYFWLNSFRGSKWLENVERDGEVTLALIDPHNMYRYAEVRGKLVEATEEGGSEHINRLSIRYRGEPYSRAILANQVRVKIQIEPRRIIGSIDWQPPGGG